MQQGWDAPGAEARQRMVIERLSETWRTHPPQHPILVAGSTGSRGATSIFMEAVARLPQGAVILPGVDFDMSDQAWQTLEANAQAQDHPQYRFVAYAQRLGLSPQDIAPWTDAAPPVPARNRLISLSLRPAPVTDQWLIEGRDLTDLGAATEGLALIEADSPRSEATAIAVALRDAADRGVVAALVSPDRVLTRQVTAALDRWGIVPDDSAGRPLTLSAPGRLLRQISALFGRKITGDALLALLKHPLVSTGTDRGQHLLNTRELELWLRRSGPAFVTRHDILRWAGDNDLRLAWATWVADWLSAIPGAGPLPLATYLDNHVRLAESLCAGSGETGSGALWEAAAGQEAQRVTSLLHDEAEHGGPQTAQEYSAVFENVLNTGDVRETLLSHPGIMIWGTLESRVQGADLLILGGLNEGTWPEAARPDPWLNRMLRARAGLLLPERQIGLYAHDYQQAACAPTVILSRAIRDADAQTVPSRWLNRLTNLLGGLGPDGKTALDGMRTRGAQWCALAGHLDVPLATKPPAPRPSPRPPVAARPDRISVTEVQRLVRDPYAIFARRVLRLNALDPLRRQPDAPLRGTVFHEVLESFVKQPISGVLETDCAAFIDCADAILAAHAGWPATRMMWLTRLRALATWFIDTEYARRSEGAPISLEARAELALSQVGMSLDGKIDRIDRLESGGLTLYDYKTGAVPTKDERKHFDKQLLLSALLAEEGVIGGLVAAPVAQIGYIGLGARPSFEPEQIEPDAIAVVKAELIRLLAMYRQDQQGYTSRRAIRTTDIVGDYDHLARYGEWDESDLPKPQDVR
ncbi:MAG: PD-(D/E)XK nuclease family protein [Pseudomonadota bacterium]